MIACHRCGKENQDHYKFCLGCGAELTGVAKSSSGGDVGMMKTVMADVRQSPTPPGGAPAVAGASFPGSQFGAPPPGPPPAGPPPAGPPPGVPTASTGAMSPMDEATDVSGPRGMMGAPAPRDAPGPGSPVSMGRPMTQPAGPGVPMSMGASARPAGPRSCPNCKAMVPAAFKFCGVCGFKMPEDLAGSAPRDDSAKHLRQPRAAAYMTLIRPDGSEGGTHELADGDNHIGRNHGDLFENDGYLSPTHASLIIKGQSAIVRDLDSLNGVFVKMTKEEELEPGQVIRIGQELLRYDAIDPPEPLEDGTEVMGSPNPGYWGKITVIIGKGVDGSAYPLLGDSVTLGRERGEINFPDDGYVSGLHARLSNQTGRVVLTDLGSSNGTFIKVKHERELRNDAFVLLGQQLFRISLT